MGARQEIRIHYASGDWLATYEEVDPAEPAGPAKRWRQVSYVPVGPRFPVPTPAETGYYPDGRPGSGGPAVVPMPPPPVTAEDPQTWGDTHGGLNDPSSPRV